MASTNRSSNCFTFFDCRSMELGEKLPGRLAQAFQHRRFGTRLRAIQCIEPLSSYLRRNLSVNFREDLALNALYRH